MDALEALVDFANTTRRQTDPFEAPHTAAAWWAAQRGRFPGVSVVEKPRFDGALLRELRDLRGAVEALLTAEPGSTGAVQTVDAILAKARLSAAIESGRARIVHAATDAAGAVLLPIALAAVSLDETARPRCCANPMCRALFVDRTKNGAKRWCALACMERVRRPRRRSIGA